MHTLPIVPLAATIRGATGVRRSEDPSIVFIHGLDTWRGTWKQPADELARRGFTSISVDLRGHGESPLGHAADFSPQQLARDVRAAICRAGFLNGDMRIALVGHSLGGMVAMRYAAEYPEDLRVLIIEDIDCVPWGNPPPSNADLQRMKDFNRHFSCIGTCQATLVSFGYSQERVERWLKEDPPRLFEHPEGGIWSAINPYAHHLATATIGNQDDAYKALHRIAAARLCHTCDFRVHLFIAGRGDLPNQMDALSGGVHDMCAVVPGLEVTQFPQASHSIHISALTDFVDKLESILRVV